MEALKANYKNDKFTGMRKYEKIDNPDGSISLNDVTTYEETGDIYSAADINITNQAINRMIGITNVTLLSSSWNSTAPYVQTISIPALKASDTPIPGLVYPSGLTEALQAQIDKSANMITKMETIDGGMKVTCAFKKPIADIIISLKGV